MRPALRRLRAIVRRGSQAVPTAAEWTPTPVWSTWLANFEPATLGLLESVEATEPGLVFDFGCGPGSTTLLIQETLRPRTLVGVESSAVTLRIAESRAELNGCRFVRANVTTFKPDGAQPDVIYCRFLLSHLPTPIDQVRRWLTLLPAGGLLITEELDSVGTDDDTLSEYCRVAEEASRMRGTVWLAGKELRDTVSLQNVEAVANQVVPVDLPLEQARAFFLSDLDAIITMPAVRGSEIPARAQAVRTALRETAPTAPLTWEVRQTVLRVTAG